MAERTPWVAIDVAAEALGVSIASAYRIAEQDGWAHDSQRPRHYRLTDIRTTWQNRQPEKKEQPRP